MGETPGAIPPSEARVSTGSPELDTILHGGLVPHRPYLIVGPAGTGKTTLALEFLCEGIRRGERCLLVTLEEPPNEMRINHRGLLPDLEKVFVFDAIPDVMRYERTPFKDIAAVRESVPFEKVPLQIRKTPELSSVEVTFTALEQTLKMEIARRHYTRLVIDSLTALQYFCMKGVDEIVGAQTFLRFLSDLHVTTLLTVESPLEDVETPERLLARGEIRLFRWELDGRTVRAIGVEKLRGSSHDVRLHPYRISPRGLDINLGVTISRDTRRVIEEAVPAQLEAPEGPVPLAAVDPLVQMEEDIADLSELGVPLGAVRVALAESAAALQHDRPEEALRCYLKARQLVREQVERAGVPEPRGEVPPDPTDPRSIAQHRLHARAAEARLGTPPLGERELPPVADRLLLLANRIHPEGPIATPGAVATSPPRSPATLPPPPGASSAAPPPPPPPARPSASVTPSAPAPIRLPPPPPPPPPMAIPPPPTAVLGQKPAPAASREPPPLPEAPPTLRRGSAPAAGSPLPARSAAPSATPPARTSAPARTGPAPAGVGGGSRPSLPNIPSAELPPPPARAHERGDAPISGADDATVPKRRKRVAAPPRKKGPAPGPPSLAPTTHGGSTGEAATKPKRRAPRRKKGGSGESASVDDAEARPPEPPQAPPAQVPATSQGARASASSSEPAVHEGG